MTCFLVLYFSFVSISIHLLYIYNIDPFILHNGDDDNINNNNNNVERQNKIYINERELFSFNIGLIVLYNNNEC